MRENRPYGSEGGVGENRFLPLSWYCWSYAASGSRPAILIVADLARFCLRPGDSSTLVALFDSSAVWCSNRSSRA